MDWDWGGALKGGLSGAGAGALTGNPYAIAGLGLAGAGMGGMAGGAQDKANQIRQDGTKAATQQQQQAAALQYKQRHQDLLKAQSYFGPAAEALQRLYGIDPKSFFPNGPNNANVAPNQAINAQGDPTAGMPRGGFRANAAPGQGVPPQGPLPPLPPQPQQGMNNPFITPYSR